MKRIISAGVGVVALAVMAQPAMAADLPTRPPVVKAPAAAPIFDWTGFYVGVQGGYGWGKSRHIDVGGGPAITDRFRIDGWLGGPTLGFNWQFASPFVVGVEADFSWSGIEGAAKGLSGNFGCSVDPGCLTDVKWVGTARVRAGVTAGQSLGYVTGGLAYGKIFAFESVLANASVKRTGWTAGAGWEHAFAPNWSAKVEYLFIDLGEFEYHPSGPYRTEARFHMVRAGLNYRFATGKAPVVTRY